ncbi:MAG: hypothetical protein LQ343_006148 [Gyalolechia ehrenbergii]|nr:MAG: hypothetical protein LQ343_006148 [Gyalolechia ehrenbergii]
MSPSPPLPRSRILFLGDDIVHNPEIYKRLTSQFDIIQPPLAHLQRQAFIQHLKDRTWGDFQAIMRPSWHTGGEMGRWDRELIELLPPQVKVSASAGAGYDWVDVGCLAEHGILYCNGAGASTEAVGDMALYHIISVFRQMTHSSLAARSTDPKRFRHAHHALPSQSRNPRSHTLAILGLGNIGFAIARKAHAAFGMKIIYHDLVRKNPEQENVVQATFYENVADMLKVTDCLLLATPSTFSGQPFLTKETIALLPRGARFVNIARGILVDEDALADALETGHIAAAGLDVHAKEPDVSARLAGMSNVTMTCHTGGGAVETNVGFERLAMENVERVLSKREALTGVNGHLIAEIGKRKLRNGVQANGVGGGGDGAGVRYDERGGKGDGVDGKGDWVDVKRNGVDIVGSPTS